MVSKIPQTHAHSHRHTDTSNMCEHLWKRDYYGSGDNFLRAHGKILFYR